MKSKNTLLIITSAVALIALLGVQTNLINNTYQLEDALFIKETDQATSNIDNLPQLDSLLNAWGDDLKDHISDYQNQRISKSEVLNRFILKANTISPVYSKIYQQELKAINFIYDVEFKKELFSVIIFINGIADTLFPLSELRENKLFGDNFNSNDAEAINASRWFTEHEFIQQKNGAFETVTYDLEVKTQNLMLIKNRNHIIFGRMTNLLILSVLIFIFVIGLLYYSIKNLINQKKISEVKTDFINNMTHELKTPLATLSIASKSLKNETIKNTPEIYLNTLQIIDRQNSRLQKLIDQVMSNSLGSQDINLNKEQIIDQIYFNNLIADFKLSVQHIDLTIHNQICKTDTILRIDKFHFTTALLNILENAVKYGHKTVIIDFKTEVVNNNYLIQIKDNGIGISEKDQMHIFEKFYRVNSGNLHNVKGLGLGMYYTKQIVAAHKGTVKINSRPDTGSTFTINIPIDL